MAKIKVNITFDEELLARIDEHSDDNYMSRSGVVNLAVAQYLNAVQVQKAFVDMSVSMRKIADNNEVDAESMSQLEDFERLAKMLMEKKGV